MEKISFFLKFYVSSAAHCTFSAACQSCHKKSKLLSNKLLLLFTIHAYFIQCIDSTSSLTDVYQNQSVNLVTKSPNKNYKDFAYPLGLLTFIIIVCGLIICVTILGNVLVCTAVAIVKKLRTPSNLLIVSLAVSDLLVASLVMPFALVYEVKGRWVFGQQICDVWTSLDVFLCTSSILNLCMISIDRYFVITRPFQYAMKRTPARISLMIFAVWLVSALIR